MQFLAFGLFAGIAAANAIPTRVFARQNGTLSALDTTSSATAGDSPTPLAPSDPPTAQDVINSINNWATSVNTVNAFLNSASTLGASLALQFALDEPVQLGTLTKVAGLTSDGVSAGVVLTTNFGSIPANLQNTINGQQSLTVTTTSINLNRCCTVLPAINTLWQDACNAVGIAVPPPIELENPCADIACTLGASLAPAA